jgi:hypothetical protein
LRTLQVGFRNPGETTGFGWICDAGEAAPIEQITVVSEFVAQDGGCAGAASNSVDKVQAEAPADELPVVWICLNLSHYYEFVTNIIALTGYRGE